MMNTSASLLILLLVTVAAATPALGDFCSDTDDYNGHFEFPQIDPNGERKTAALEYGWTTKGDTKPRVTYRENSNAFEGNQVLEFSYGGSINRTFEVPEDMKVVRHVALTYSFVHRPTEKASEDVSVDVYINQEKITVIVDSPSDFKRGIRDWPRASGFAHLPYHSTGVATFAIHASGPLYVDDLKVGFVESIRRNEVPTTTVEAGDYLQVTATCVGGMMMEVDFDGLADTLSDGLRCVEKSGKIVESNKKSHDDDFYCDKKLNEVHIPSTHIKGCHGRYVVQYAVQAVKASAGSIESVGVVQSDSWFVKHTAGTKVEIDIKAASPFPAPASNQFIVNGDFEQPRLHGLTAVDVRDSSRLVWKSANATVGLWRSGHEEGLMAPNGTQFAVIDPQQNLYQDLKLTPGLEYFWGFKHRGFSSRTKIAVNMGTPDLLARQTEIRSQVGRWSMAVGIYKVPEGQLTTRFEIVMTKGVGLLDAVRISKDSIEVESEWTDIPDIPCNCECCEK